MRKLIGFVITTSSPLLFLRVRRRMCSFGFTSALFLYRSGELSMLSALSYGPASIFRLLGVLVHHRVTPRPSRLRRYFFFLCLGGVTHGGLGNLGCDGPGCGSSSSFPELSFPPPSSAAGLVDLITACFVQCVVYSSGFGVSDSKCSVHLKQILAP